jgi:hypothetical protein
MNYLFIQTSVENSDPELFRQRNTVLIPDPDPFNIRIYEF